MLTLLQPYYRCSDARGYFLDGYAAPFASSMTKVVISIAYRKKVFLDAKNVVTATAYHREVVYEEHSQPEILSHIALQICQLQKMISHSLLEANHM